MNSETITKVITELFQEMQMRQLEILNQTQDNILQKLIDNYEPEDNEKPKKAEASETEEKCNFVLTKGNRIGETCGKKAKEEDRCTTHLNSKVKKPKKKRDPNAPKAPLTTYMMFSNDKRPEIQKNKPEMVATEIAKVLSGMWKNITEKEKAYYQNIYDKNKEIFQEEKKKYEESKRNEDVWEAETVAIDSDDDEPLA